MNRGTSDKEKDWVASSYAKIGFADKAFKIADQIGSPMQRFLAFRDIADYYTDSGRLELAKDAWLHASRTAETESNRDFKIDHLILCGESLLLLNCKAEAKEVLWLAANFIARLFSLHGYDQALEKEKLERIEKLISMEKTGLKVIANHVDVENVVKP